MLISKKICYTVSEWSVEGEGDMFNLCKNYRNSSCSKKIPPLSPMTKKVNTCIIPVTS